MDDDTTDTDDLEIVTVPVAETGNIGLPKEVLDFLGVKPGAPLKVEKGLGEYVAIKPVEGAFWVCRVCGQENDYHRSECKNCGAVKDIKKEDE